MARVEVPMPQMGESIAEGTVSKWLKQVGDDVARDEPILEISTDKVDAEIPAPTAGTLVEIAVEEGQTVEVGTIVAFIETEKGAAAGNGGKAASAPAKEEEGEDEEAEPAAEEPAEAPPEKTAAKADKSAGPAAKAAPAGKAEPAGEDESADERLRRRSTPLVRRIAEEHGVDIAEVEGSGRAGRVTKQDIMGYLETREEKPAAKAPAAKTEKAAAAAPPERPAAAVPAASGPMDEDGFWKTFYGKVRHPEFPVRDADKVEPMSRIRQLTADHMVRAKRIAPHVHSFIEIDFTAVDRVRNAHKKKWADQGVKVSYTAFVAWAVAKVLPEFPMVNGTVSGQNLVFRGNINIGIAVDLNPGLIVPVIRDADEVTLVGIGKRINDLAERARSRKLAPDESQGATFSITNPGVLGTYVGMPVIPEGTSAILGTGAIEKRPVVIEVDGTDAIVIRKRSMFSLGYDHRIVDGADAARFLAKLKETMESFPDSAA